MPVYLTDQNIFYSIRFCYSLIDCDINRHCFLDAKFFIQPFLSLTAIFHAVNSQQSNQDLAVSKLY